MNYDLMSKVKLPWRYMSYIKSNNTVTTINAPKVSIFARFGNVTFLMKIFITLKVKFT